MEFLRTMAALLSLPLFLAGFAWYAMRARRSGVGHSLMAPFEEIWDPIAHKTNIEIQIAAERAPGTPSPGDPPMLPWGHVKVDMPPARPAHRVKDAAA